MKIIIAPLLSASVLMACNIQPCECTDTLIENNYHTETTLETTLEKTFENTYVIQNHYIDETRASMSALSSVELNPDHEGFSVGLGGATYQGTTGGAIGLMYGSTYQEYNIGINAKGYKSEGGYQGGSIGLTIGF